MTIFKVLVQKLEPNIRGFSRDFKGARGYKLCFCDCTYIYIYMTPVFHFVFDSSPTSFKINFQDFAPSKSPNTGV